MQKTRKNSRLEVWVHDYIDFLDKRDPDDADLIILQIEPGTSPGYYMVEVIDKKEVEYFG